MGVIYEHFITTVLCQLNFEEITTVSIIELLGFGISLSNMVNLWQYSETKKKGCVVKLKSFYNLNLNDSENVFQNSHQCVNESQISSNNN